MLDLAILQAGSTVGMDQLPEAPTILGTVKSVALPLAAVTGAYGLGRRWLMAEYLPDDLSAADLDNATPRRSARFAAVMALAYVLGVALTAAAVYLLAGLAWSLAWAGGWALLAAGLALLAARDASPIGDVRLLAEARRQRDDGTP